MIENSEPRYEAVYRIFELPNCPPFRLVWVEGGSFMMGSEEEEAYEDEQPVHQVEVPSFYYGQFPVTQALWQAVMGQNPAYFPGADRPVERVSWYDAAVFLNQLNALAGHEPLYFADPAFQEAFGWDGQAFVLQHEDGDEPELPVYLKPHAQGFRLPSEAEWEYAAKGGKHARGYKYAGGDNLDAVGWYDGNSHQESKPVGWKLPNELGLFDMSGNVLEWCEDQWHDSYEGAPADGSAWTDQQQGTFRVIRGGGWGDSPGNCRPAYRIHDHPAIRNDFVGLRVVLVVPPV
jgi:formylglycine-generating enzyme